MSDTTRAVVIEGVPLVRAGISSVLREEHVAVVAEASSAEEASSLVRGSDAHLLVLGEEGAGLADAIARVKDRNRDVRIVAVVAHCNRDLLLAILDAGADAIVPSDVDRDQLVAAVEAVRAGGRHIAPSLTAVLFASIKAIDADRVITPTAGVLTPREEAIVRLVAQGQTNDEIGRQLFISPATVKTHLSNAYVKLGARNRYDAVVKATQLGLL
jgi:DNA-binding NarL/FixJ family response regulator